MSGPCADRYRMPGLSGLELIEKISQTDLNIQFILLSGFGEFEYAKQAMRFRVHHYLLKPCNEDQIIESIQDVIKEHFHQKAFQDMQERQKNLVTNLHYNLLSNIIHERIFLQDEDGPSWIPTLDTWIFQYRLRTVFFLLCRRKPA